MAHAGELLQQTLPEVDMAPGLSEEQIAAAAGQLVAETETVLESVARETASLPAQMGGEGGVGTIQCVVHGKLVND